MAAAKAKRLFTLQQTRQLDGWRRG